MIVSAGAAVAAMAGLEVSYRVALTTFPRLPEPVAIPGEMGLQVGWASLGGTGPMRLDPLYPWSFGRVASLEHLGPSTRAARYVALFHIATLEAEGRIAPASSLAKGLRERVLIVWVSRHWSVEQLVGWIYLAGAYPPPEAVRRGK